MYNNSIRIFGYHFSVPFSKYLTFAVCYKEVCAMCKRVLSILLCGFFCAFFSLGTPVWAAVFDLGELSACKRIFACGNSAAYFYGYKGTTLISSRISGDCLTSRVNVSGAIYAVTHSGRFTYALFAVSNTDYGIIRLNADSGDYSVFDIHSDCEIDPQCIAASENGIFLLSLNGIYRGVTGFDLNGNKNRAYSLPRGCERLFSNGSSAYALAGNGEIYLLGGSNAVYCANTTYDANISDAGEGYIYSDGRLISLTDGSSVFCGTHLAATGKNGAVKSDSGLLMTSADGLIYLLNSDYTCTVTDDSQDAAQSESQLSREGSDIFVSSGTTVEQLKKMYPEIKTVYNKNGNAVTGRTVCTGYTADSLSVIVLGDVDGSGTVSSRDVKELMRLQIGDSNLNGVFLKAADFNRDGQVDNRDILLIAKK